MWIDLDTWGVWIIGYLALEFFAGVALMGWAIRQLWIGWIGPWFGR